MSLEVFNIIYEETPTTTTKKSESDYLWLSDNLQEIGETPVGWHHMDVIGKI